MNELQLIDRSPRRGEGPAPGTRDAGRRFPGWARDSLGDDLRAVIPGAIAVFLMLYWAVDDGGTDAETWYWGALLALATVAALGLVTRSALAALPRALKLALLCFAAYTAWSYLSMTWAAYAGLALEGSNRTLLYLLLFAMMAIAPWRRATALLVFGAFAAGIGVIAVAFLVRFALGAGVGTLYVEGRLAAPTGYFNATAALFTIGALVALTLAARRSIAAPLRGLFAALATADLMLAVIPQSRGWLFTLPIVGLWAVIFAGDRLRAIAVAIPAAAATLIVIHRLLAMFDLNQSGGALTHPAIHGGTPALLGCAGVFGVVTLGGWIEEARGRPALGRRPRLALGTAAIVLAVLGMLGGLYAVSDHHPASFISKQLKGFASEPKSYDTTDHFVQVGSGRWDIWRSGLKAWKAHPIGGLGQDNFGDWYLTHRHTDEEPLWTHSLWIRLLAHTGSVGFLLFLAFLVAAIASAVGARRRGPADVRALAGAALLPLGVWLIHGSIDWFWEVPALSGPALCFLAMAARLRVAPEVLAAEAATSPADALDNEPPPAAAPAWRIRVPRPAFVLAGGVTVAALTVVLGLPYLAVRELDLGITASHTDVNASLADFRTSHRLNPLMSDPGVLAGSVALINGRDSAAAGWYRQAVGREPGSWIGWLGRGLADSAQGEVDQATRSFDVALHLDRDQVVVRNAARLVGTRHPLSAQQAFQEIDYLP